MPGILDRMACGVALALALGGRVKCRRPPPEAKKRLFFEECSMCRKHRKYRKGRFGQGAGAQKSRTPGGILFFSDFLIICDVAFFCVKI